MLINAYATVREVEPPTFPARVIGQRDRSDPELTPHLNGLSGYVVKFGGPMTVRLFDLLQQISRVQTHLSLEVEEDQFDAFAGWATRVNAVCIYPDGRLCDPSGRVLVAPNGVATDPAAVVPQLPDSLDRRARSEAALTAHRLQVAASLPPVVGEREVVLRGSDSVARRCLSLFVVAVRGESLANGPVIPVRELKDRMPLAFEGLSPKEQRFMREATWLDKLKAGRKGQPSDDRQMIVDAVWRYESLAALLWALGQVDDLGFPERICDVPAIAQRMIGLDAPQFVAGARLRPAGELLDALDLHYRLHWVVRQAGLDKHGSPAGLEAGVVRERHFALNWLVGFGGAEWDDVDTPT